MLDLTAILSVEQVAAALTSAASFVLSPSKRIYWGFLLSSAVFALVFSYCYRRSAGFTGALADLINPNALFSRSSAVDVSLLFVNQLLRMVLFVPVLGGQLAVSLSVSRSLNSVYESPQFAPSAAVLMVAFTLCFFVFDDFTRFLLHRAMHKLPWLWRFHKLHHSAPTLTPLTLYRFHPVESLLLTVRSIITGGLVVGVFLYAFAGRITGWDILGVNALGFICSALGSNLRHSHIPLSFGVLEHWLISPAQHQLHHSTAHVDINFGTYLAVWDRLLGSWVQGSPQQKLEFGLIKR